MRPRPRTLALLALALLLVSACPKRVVINGQSVDYDEAAQAAYNDAMRSRDAGNNDEALRKLDDFMNQFAKSDLADDALNTIGALALQQGQTQRARAAYERLLLEHPRSPHSTQAQLKLARIDVERGHPEDAVAPLRQVYDKLGTDDERRQVALTLAETLDQGGQFGEACQWYLKAYAQSDDDATRADILQHLLELIDARLSFSQARRLAEEVDIDSPEGELLHYKLARIYCHLRDYALCSETIDAYLRAHPTGRFAQDARAQQQWLQARLTVSPTVVGVVLPLTGKYAIYGKRSLWAMQAGAELLKDKSRGGLTFEVMDSEGRPEVAAAAVEELALKKHAILILGAILQNTSQAAALKAEELGVPLLSISRREGLCQLGPQVFRYGLTNTKQARALADLSMGKMGFSRFAILYPRHAYGLELMNAFWDEIEKRHGLIVGAEAYDHDETTFVEPIKRLVGRSPARSRGAYVNCTARARWLKSGYARNKAVEACATKLPPITDFDALLIPDDARAVGLIAPTLAFEDVLTTTDEDAIKDYRKTTGFRKVTPVQLLGANGWNQATLIERGGKYVQGSLFVDGFNPGSSEPGVQRFVKNFTDSQGSPPTIIEAQAHDAAKLTAAIIRGGLQAAPRDRREMRQRLLDVRDFPGVTGVTRFDADGESVTPLTVLTISRETIEVADLPAKPEG